MCLEKKNSFQFCVRHFLTRFDFLQSYSINMRRLSGVSGSLVMLHSLFEGKSRFDSCHSLPHLSCSFLLRSCLVALSSLYPFFLASNTLMFVFFPFLLCFSPCVCTPPLASLSLNSVARLSLVALYSLHSLFGIVLFPFSLLSSLQSLLAYLHSI